ncbi:MAG: hypothetical protein ABR500_13425 [Dermatophilaceae bacterium]
MKVAERGVPESTGRWDTATAGLIPPFAIVDLDAFDANAADRVTRAGGLPALEEVRSDARLAAQITVAIDSVEHVRLYAGLAGDIPLKVAVDVDASLRLGWLHLGERRWAIRTAEEARTRGAGGNGGGTGRLHVTREDPAITELAAGSGLYGPGLFDGYDAFTPRTERPACQRGGGLRALRRAASRPGRRDRRDGADLARRGPLLRLSVVHPPRRSTFPSSHESRFPGGSPRR